MRHIAIVEDDPALRELVAYAMETCNYTPHTFATGEDFLAAYRAGSVPDLMLLDITLPGISGTDLLRTMKEDGDALIPIIFLSGRDGEMDKVIALDLGADDYITKPFGVLELGARVKAVLRRTSRNSGPEREILHNGSLILDVNSHIVTVDDKECTLTKREFALLEVLMRNAGSVLSRQEILDHAWGIATEIETRTVDMHVKTLRRKLGDAGRFIHTVRGVGYRFDATQI